MYGSSIDESTTSDSRSTALSTTLNVLMTKSSESICRVGSVAGVISDAEGGTKAESRKLPSSRFKGVVPQPNGRWGAQIYEKHQRVWLGTFNGEDEAARAYDIAAQRFRGRDAVTNFKPFSEGEEEDEYGLIFLNSHSKAEIVDMLRKHTYNDELEQSKRKLGEFRLDANGKKVCKGGISSSLCGLDKGPKAREELFEKSLTPSDVGKLNRLVIPKQHAEKYFPLQSCTTTTSGVLLNFQDVGGKVWRFRYSYWKSSQSYVLTKGWSRFVKEKKLKAGDTVSFHRSIENDSQLYIDWKHSNVPSDEAANCVLSSTLGQVQIFRFFGVDIIKGPGGNVNVIDSNNRCGKRNRGIEMIEAECSKKQMLINVL